MSDFVFLGATVVFFAICVLYVKWCDMIVGSDDFSSETPETTSDATAHTNVDGAIR